MRFPVLILCLAASSLAACGGPGAYTITASVPSPDLVYVQPGVYAVANADQPVFYADNSYWLYADGIWYQSSYPTGGWSYAPAPYVIQGIRRPLAYYRYNRYRPERRVHVDIRNRPPARVYPGTREQTRPLPPPPPNARVIERDYRSPPPPPPPPAPNARVIERDHRSPPPPPPAPNARVIERDHRPPPPPAPNARVIERDHRHDDGEPRRDRD